MLLHLNDRLSVAGSGEICFSIEHKLVDLIKQNLSNRELKLCTELASSV